MTRAALAVLLLAAVPASAGAGAAPFAAVEVPDGASESQLYAAEEFAAYHERITGLRPRVVRASTARDGARRLSIATADPEYGLGDDGFLLVALASGDVCVVGSASRGCLYGVYEILERFGGVRWYSSDCVRVPRAAGLDIPDGLEETQIPAFEMRQALWHDVIAHPEFAARLRMNGFSHSKGAAAKFGGDSYRFGGGLSSCHTFGLLLPPERYFDSHPEYFSLVGGRRLRERSQLCLTNPDVLAIVVSNVLERIRADPGARFYGVSQNDWFNGCECPKCAAVDAEEGSRAGTLVRFVNAVAAAVEREFPDVRIETLAYQYTRRPPKKTRLRRNVVPCLCTIECDFAHPIATGLYAENESFRRDIAGWAAQTDALYLWDYTTSFNAYPQVFPNVGVLRENLRFFRDSGVKMVFEQGAYQGSHAGFAELKTWLLAKFMWNPDQPVEPLLDDFFAGFYGKAAPFVRADCEDALARYAARPDAALSIFDGCALAALSEDYFAAAEARRVAALAAVADDAEHLRNVRKWAFSIDFTRFVRLKKRGWNSFSPDEGRLYAELAARLRAELAAVPGIRLAENGTANARLLAAIRDASTPAAGLSRDNLIAHRGMSELAPENTPTAYRLASEGGFGFECDVYLSRDGRVFSFHDPTLKRIAGIDKRCADCDWDEVKDLDVGSWKGKEWSKERPCLLEDILRLARDGRILEVDVKFGPEIVPAIKRLVEAQTNATPRNLVFASARANTIAALREAMPAFGAWMGVTCRRGWGRNDPPRPVEEALEIVRKSKASGVALGFDPAVVTAEYIAAFHRAGYYVNVWTVDDAESARLAVERGADTVTSNRPNRLLEESAAAQRTAASL